MLRTPGESFFCPACGPQELWQLDYYTTSVFHYFLGDPKDRYLKNEKLIKNNEKLETNNLLDEPKLMPRCQQELGN
jgi:hypothetical protein